MLEKLLKQKCKSTGGNNQDKPVIIKINKGERWHKNAYVVEFKDVLEIAPLEFDHQRQHG